MKKWLAIKIVFLLLLFGMSFITLKTIYGTSISKTEKTPPKNLLSKIVETRGIRLGRDFMGGMFLCLQPDFKELEKLEEAKRRRRFLKEKKPMELDYDDAD
ncbi:MAG: hypothetical protein GY754_24000, partial [bacterium]|nr:hypothetical protein [bacterium]